MLVSNYTVNPLESNLYQVYFNFRPVDIIIINNV
jgi:hypothetical protein